MAEKIEFGKKETQILKGIGIILMVCNHLYPIPEWIFPENQFIDFYIGPKGLAAYFGGFSKICVAIFAFLSGIGFYYTYKKYGLIQGYKHNIKKLIPFYLTYWVCILAFYLPIIYVCGADYKPTFLSVLLNLIGYETTIIKIAWYVRFYLEVVLLSPIWIQIYDLLYAKLENKFRINKSSTLTYLFFMSGCVGIVMFSKLLPALLGKYIKEFFMYLPIVAAGYGIEKGKIISRICNYLNRDKRKLLLLGIIYPLVFMGCFLGRGLLNKISWFNCDIIIAPIFVFFTWGGLQFLNNKHINDILGFLGSVSLEIWFLHAIFFIGNSGVQKIAYWGRYPIIILVWTITILIPIALCIKQIVNYILKKGFLKRL